MLNCAFFKTILTSRLKTKQYGAQYFPRCRCMEMVPGTGTYLWLNICIRESRLSASRFHLRFLLTRRESDLSYLSTVTNPGQLSTFVFIKSSWSFNNINFLSISFILKKFNFTTASNNFSNINDFEIVSLQTFLPLYLLYLIIWYWMFK